MEVVEEINPYLILH